ncbi:hypothetical protein ABPG72_018088 [Tetrahymena utriculariae]
MSIIPEKSPQPRISCKELKIPLTVRSFILVEQKSIHTLSKKTTLVVRQINRQKKKRNLRSSEEQNYLENQNKQQAWSVIEKLEVQQEVLVVLLKVSIQRDRI